MKINRILRSTTFWRWLLSFAMAGIFVAAGILKLADPPAFTEDILRFRLLPETWSTFLSVSLSWLEIFIGVAVFFRPFRISASFLMTALMGVFTLAVASALLRGLDVSCGCFGKDFSEYATSGLSFLLRDMILFIVTAILFGLCLFEAIKEQKKGSLLR